MWNRAEIKAKGKENFKKNYWKSVIVAIIYYAFFMATGAAIRPNTTDISGQLQEDPQFMTILMIVLAAIGVILTVATIINIFLINPLEVGCKRFFFINQDEEAQFGEVGYAYKNNYGHTVAGLLLKDIFILIGFMLFVIPGCILTYSYRLVPYILADDPTLSGPEAVKKSRMMMKGYKWKTFVFDLSFILWDILSGITCGLVGVFYVNPYKLNAEAALYQAIKAETNN